MDVPGLLFYTAYPYGLVHSCFVDGDLGAASCVRVENLWMLVKQGSVSNWRFVSLFESMASTFSLTSENLKLQEGLGCCATVCIDACFR